MSEIMQIQCFKCHAVYEVPPEMVGQLVECAGCNAVFTVPAPLPERSDTPIATFPHVEIPDKNSAPELGEKIDIAEIPPDKPVEVPDHPPLDTSFDLPPAEPSTGTIKLSRANIGMMPTINDSFNFTTVEQKVPKNPRAGASGLDSVYDRKSPNSTQTPPATPAAKIPWWQFWKKFSKK